MTTEMVRRLDAIFKEPTGRFDLIVAAAGLEPSKDFRDRDLSGVDLSKSILIGFDFRNCDLRGTNLRYAEKVDATVIFSGCQLDKDDRLWLNECRRTAEIKEKRTRNRPRKPKPASERSYRIGNVGVGARFVQGEKSLSVAQGRITEIWSDSANGSFGSGYLLGGGLILTARHVVMPDGSEPPTVIKARPLGIAHLGKGLQPADLVWPERAQLADPHAPDAVLLRLRDFPMANSTGPRLGQPDDGGGRGTRVSATGFPAFAEKAAGGRRDTQEISGIVFLGARLVAGRFEIEDMTVRDDREPLNRELDWHGMSGAALLSGGRVIGVLIARKQANQRYDFSAVRTETLLAIPEFVAAIRGHVALDHAAVDREAGAFAGQIVHPNVEENPNFAGREEDLARIDAALSAGRTAALAGSTPAAAPPIGVLVAGHGRIETFVQGIDPETRANISELLEIARQGGAFQRAEQEGISEFAVRKIVVRLGGEGIAQADLLPWLDNWIEAAPRELGRHTNEDEAFEAARREAGRRFKAGLESPSSALMDEFAREERAELERQEERKGRRLRLLEEAIRFDELVLDADAATQKLRRMAEIEGRSGWQEVGAYLFAQAGEYYERGDQKGENSALLISIAAYRAALEERTRDRVPLQWARTQNNLGNALRTLGERESGTARLEEAVSAYRAALEEMTRDRVPLDWARTQNNLGLALSTLGARESGTARLEEAVSAYRAALEEMTRDRVPLDWARTQNNLGFALSTLGARESGTARLEEAVSACRAALEEMTRDRVPLDWARTQNNLGLALSTLGERESGTARLEEAVSAYRAALKEWTSEVAPHRHDLAQRNMARCLALVGQRRKLTHAHQKAP